MKKIIATLCIAGALGLISPAALTASPGRDPPKPQAASVLTVGATPVPYEDLLNLVKPDLAAQGIELRVVEFTDYAAPNAALIAGELDANYFQHTPYLETNPGWKAALSAAFGVHVEPLGLYSNSLNALGDLKEGTSIAIPNDPADRGRALLLLQSQGIITLSPGAGLTATPQDITHNPHTIRFRELEAPQLLRSLGDVDAAIIHGSYALEAGLKPLEDALILEGAASPYVNIVAVRKGNEGDPRIKALETALRSQKVKDYIAKTWGDGRVIAIF